MPDVINDMGAKRYAKLAWNGIVVPACGCVFGAVYHLIAGLWQGVENWYTRTWAAVKVDFHMALDEFRRTGASK